MTPSTSEWTARASSSCTGSPSMSPRSTTLRPGRPPSKAKMPPVSVVRSASSIPSDAMWSRISAVVSCSAKASSGRRCERAAQVDHVVEDGVGGCRPEQVAHVTG